MDAKRQIVDSNSLLESI